MPFELAPGLTISIKGYIPLNKQTPSRACYVYEGEEQAQVVQSETAQVDFAARTVEKSELRKGYKFGGEHICFKPEELMELKQMGKKTLRVIGFKKRSKIPSWASVKKSIFIFPSEEQYVGSTRVFSALWQKLLKDDKVGIAWFVARENAHPVMVAIFPSGNPDDEEANTPYLPAGLWLYPLPFADDVRSTDHVSAPARPADELTDQMRLVIQNLQLPKAMYDPRKYPNPSLQWHYKILQAKALEEVTPETKDMVDLTLPKFKQIDKRVGGYLAEWKEMLAKKARNLQEDRAVKREFEDDGDERPTKRSKTAKKATNAGPANSNADLKKAFEQGTLSKMTVAELKDIMASKGISTAGRKAELVERLEEWIEGNL